MTYQNLPPCSRPGCGHPAYDDHGPTGSQAPHACTARECGCPDYMTPPGTTLADFMPGGGSGGGGGASGTW